MDQQATGSQGSRPRSYTEEYKRQVADPVVSTGRRRRRWRPRSASITHVDVALGPAVWATGGISGGGGIAAATGRGRFPQARTGVARGPSGRDCAASARERAVAHGTGHIEKRIAIFAVPSR